MNVRAATLILTASLACSAGAQWVPDDPSALRLERIEQGFEDVSPLATSLEQYDYQLRQPIGFDSVYRVPGAEGLLMRQSGAVHAIFERSEYVSTRFGEYAVAPPGTIYTIGAPSEELLASLSTGPRSLLSGSASRGSRAAHASELRVSNRIGSALAPAIEDELAGVGTRSLMSASPSVWTHDVERRRRLEALFSRLPEDSSAGGDATDD